MTWVKIPFLKKFRTVLLSEKKTWTARNKRYGKRGDHFDAFGAVFRLTMEPVKMRLRYVASNHVKEGFETREGFINTWIDLHPSKGYDADQEVWVHEFVRLDNKVFSLTEKGRSQNAVGD